MFVDEIKACETGWHELLAIPGISEESRKALVSSVLQMKSKYDSVMSYALKTHESNLKCLAKLFQANQEKENIQILHNELVEVIIFLG